MKEILAQKSSAAMEMEFLTKKCGGNLPDWADDWVAKFSTAQDKVAQLFSEQPEFQRFQVAALSHTELAKMKRELGETELA